MSPAGVHVEPIDVRPFPAAVGRRDRILDRVEQLPRVNPADFLLLRIDLDEVVADQPRQLFARHSVSAADALVQVFWQLDPFGHQCVAVGKAEEVVVLEAD